MKKALLTLALFASTSAFAEKEEHREHGAHEHGHAQLSIIAEKHDLLLTIETPANNFFGFEHEPRTEEQKEAVHEAIESIENFASLLVLDSSAKCSVENVKIVQPFADEHDHKDEHAEHKDEHEHHDEHKGEHAEHKDEHKHDEHHDEHKGEHAEHKDEHKHDEHHDEHKDEHAEHKDKHKHDEHHDEHKGEHAEHKDEHKHDEHHDEHEEEVHSDVEVDVTIHCDEPSNLTTMDLTPFFKRFPLFEELETQAITGGKQSASELSKDSPIFSVKK